MTCAPKEGSGEDRTLLARAAAWGADPELDDCSTERLGDLSRLHGLDFATALFHDRVLRCPANRAFHDRVRTGGGPPMESLPLVAIVPGAFYLEHAGTGADGERIVAMARSLGCRVERVPVASFGSLAHNASILADWLRARANERVCLVSLSKGSADVKIALGMPDTRREFDRVVAWISLSGLTEGTALVDWLRRHPLRRWGSSLLLRLRGQRYAVVEELRRGKDGPLARWPAVPDGMRLVHVVGCPLQRHLAHPWAPRAYARLAPMGPNDGGGFLLGDSVRLPGVVFPVWGADHYLQPVWDASVLLRRVLEATLASTVAR